MKPIPYLNLKAVNQRYEPALSKAIGRVAASGIYLRGAEVAAFEREFADYCQASCCVGVGNGLDALTLIFLALKDRDGWAAGDEVIVPALTFVATAEAVSRAGLKPVFCDISPNDFLLDMEKFPRLITRRTRAVLPVHLYGHAARMAQIEEIATGHGLVVVEDAAQAHGARYSDTRHRVGSRNPTAFSFYPGKNLGALGDGGAVVTNDEDIADRVRQLANYGARKKYIHEVHGLNSRLDEIQAAALRVKLPFLDSDNARRRSIARIYNRIDHPFLRLPYGGKTDDDCVFHIYPLRCASTSLFSLDREAVECHLNRQGVETLRHYPLPLHRQKSYFHDTPLPEAEQAAEEELSLPISPALSSKEAERIVDILNNL